MSLILLPGQGLGWDYRQAPNAPIPSAIGGYEHGGAQYLFLYQGSEFTIGDSKIHALKSTNLGATWTDTGNVNIPPTSGVGTFGLPTYTTCMDGNTVYLMAVDLAGTGTGPSDAQTGALLLFKYDLTSNTFSSSSISGAPVVWKGWAGSTYSPNSSICLHLLRRGAGDMLLLYTSVETIGSDKYARIYVTTFNGSACGTGVLLPGQAGTASLFIERCACLDASSNLHVILSSNNFHFWYHVGMDPAGSFGSVQTVETDAYFQNDTSNLLSFPAPADTIAFLGVRNRSSSGDNGDLAIYSALGGSLTPTWSFHNLPSTANVVQDPVIAPDWLAALGYLDGTLYAYWTQTGFAPSWSVTGKQGVIKGSTAAATNLTTWTAETSIIGPFDTGTAHWGASQVAVWSGSGIGLGVLGNFEGYDTGSTGNPIESSYLITVPPAGGGGGGPTIACGSPPDGTLGDPYSHPLTVSAPVGSTVSITGGALPPGLTINSVGVISGTPAVDGSYGFVATVTPPGGTTGPVSVACTIIVQPADSGGSGGPTIACGSPPDGKVGVAYSHIFPVTDIPEGATVSYSITTGVLPPGLTLNTATGEVTGILMDSGGYAFTVTATIT